MGETLRKPTDILFHPPQWHAYHSLKTAGLLYTNELDGYVGLVKFLLSTCLGK